MEIGFQVEGEEVDLRDEQFLKWKLIVRGDAKCGQIYSKVAQGF